MNSYDLRNLQEAYLDVYEENEKLNRFQIKDLRNKKFETSRGWGSDDRFIDKERMEKHDARRGVKKKNKQNEQNEQVDLYDLILSHLLDESFSDRIDRQVKRNKEYAKKRKPVVANTFAERIDKQVEQRKKEKYRIKEQVDLYDLVLSHLLDEGYAETIESAEVMMVNMSEEWRESICEGLGGMRRQPDYDEYNREAREEMKQALSRLKKRLDRETKSQEAQKFLTKHPKKTK